MNRIEADNGNDDHGVPRELETAEAHLRQAEADLESARQVEQAAEREIGVAAEEIRAAEEHHREIHFTVDGEPCETKHRELTPNQIISEFGKQDPATSYLVEIQGNHRVSYKDKGNVEIKLHDGMCFQIISTGPKPVSGCSGAVGFVDGLRKLGYRPEALPGLPDHVFFTYLVEVGRFIGRTVRLGFVVPQDFPDIPPSGPHVSPHICPIHPGGDKPHPVGGVHDSQSQAFQGKAGGDWQYWSRPFVDWAKSKRTVAAYMAHIWRLWETQ